MTPAGQSALVVHCVRPRHGVEPSMHNPPPSAVETHAPFPPHELGLHCVKVLHVCPSHSGFGFVVHAPLVQTSPVPHATPHPPQFAGSVPSLTQTPPHEVSPSPQTDVQVPEVQTCPLEHTIPHPPQLFTSLAKFVQVEGFEPPNNNCCLRPRKRHHRGYSRVRPPPVPRR